MLETFPNPNPDRSYEIEMRCPEFTCVCPKTGQPDFATIEIRYVPDQLCVELKSLKLYLWSYREKGAFHEAVTNQILDDLVACVAPRFMEVKGIYNVRGAAYANFGLLRRSLMERLDFLDLRYHFGAWDPDLSLKVQREAGLKVVGCRRSLVVHDELIDERKEGDLDAMAADNEKLFAKWNLPAKGSYPDPRPDYQAMLVDRGLT